MFPEQDLPAFRVTRLSPTEVWLDAGGPEGEHIPAQVMHFELRHKAVAVGPLIAERLAGDTGSEVGYRLHGVSLENGRSILAILNHLVAHEQAESLSQESPIEEEITEHDRIRATVSALAVAGSKGKLLRTGRALQLELDRIDLGSSLIYWRSEQPGVPRDLKSCSIDMIGYNSAYRLYVTDAIWQKDVLVTPIPARIGRIRHRWYRRVPVAGKLTARFLHPLWRRLPRIERQVQDVSFGGLAMRIVLSEDLVYAGLELPLIEIETEPSVTISLRGQVRWVSANRAGGESLCGISVQPYPFEDEPKWLRFISKTLSPTTATSENQTEVLWNLFTESGYFNLAGKTTEQFLELKNSFVDVGKRMGRAPQLACQTIWPSSRGVEATISTYKPYSSTWALHQLAKRRRNPSDREAAPGKILQDIYYRTLEHSQVDPQFKWLISVVESTVPWVNKSHVQFALRHAGPRDAMVRPVGMVDVYCSEMSGRPHPGLQFGLATPEEKALLCRAQAATEPECFRQALDFTPETIDLPEISQQWSNSGLERERAIIVARRQGEPVAAAVLEVGELGTNLYRLLDSTRLVALGEDTTGAFIGLLDEARRWYMARGRTSFVYMCEEDPSAYADAARLHQTHSDAEPNLWIISSRLLPDFLEHVFELTSRRGFADQGG